MDTKVRISLFLLDVPLELFDIVLNFAKAAHEVFALIIVDVVALLLRKLSVELAHAALEVIYAFHELLEVVLPLALQLALHRELRAELVLQLVGARLHGVLEHVVFLLGLLELVLGLHTLRAEFVHEVLGAQLGQALTVLGFVHGFLGDFGCLLLQHFVLQFELVERVHLLLLLVLADCAAAEQVFSIILEQELALFQFVLQELHFLLVRYRLGLELVLPPGFLFFKELDLLLLESFVCFTLIPENVDLNAQIVYLLIWKENSFDGVLGAFGQRVNGVAESVAVAVCLVCATAQWHFGRTFVHGFLPIRVSELVFALLLLSHLVGLSLTAVHVLLYGLGVAVG